MSKKKMPEYMKGKGCIDPVYGDKTPVTSKATTFYYEKPFYPSNGSELMAFEDEVCSECTKRDDCKIMLSFLLDEKPKEWILKEGRPFCEKRSIKTQETIVPNQLSLFGTGNKLK